MLSMLGTIVSASGLFGSLPSLMLVGLATVIAGTALVGIIGSKRPSGFPPGPTPIPFIGNLTNIRKDGQPLWITMGELAKQYGDIFSFKLGDKWYVVLNTYETIREGMVARPVALADRPHYYSTDLFSEDYRDLAYTNYSPTWLLHREFALGTYSDVNSTNHLDAVVNQQFTRYVDQFLASGGAGEPVNGIDLGQQMAMGSLVTWCFGPDNDELHRDLVEVVSVDVSLNLVGRRIPVDVFPFLQYFPLSSNRNMRDVVDRFMAIVRTEFNRRRQVSEEDDKITDLCGALLRAQKAAEKEKKYDFLTDVHVVQVLASSFRGSLGFLTTTYWGLALLAEYPDVQQKVANEIRDVIGLDSDRQPSCDDRDTMPYTAATVMEMLRFGSIAPLGVPRAAHDDVKLNGYDIPRGTIILYNIYHTHFNENNFANPEEFNPGRFLNPDGSLIRSPDKLIPFGLGIRKCLGYALVPSFLFLNFCRLLQKYQVCKLDGRPGDGSLLGQDPEYEGARCPAPFRIGVNRRE